MDNLICPSCKKEYVAEAVLCEDCGFPFHGTEAEKARHIGKYISAKGTVTDAGDVIGKCRKILFVIAGLNIVVTIVNFLRGDSFWLDMVLNVMISAVYLVCGIFIKKAPIVMTVIPLVFIIGINILNALLVPAAVFSGLLYKIVIVSSLIYCIYSVMKANKIKKEYKI